MSVEGPGAVDPRHDRPHPDAAVEEWVFTCWEPDDSLGVICAHRTLGPSAWYWSAVVRAGFPLLHVTEWSVPLRPSAPDVLKAHGLWAEHICDAPMEQWTITNECYATALEDPDDALGRAYGLPTAVALDLEWYATAPPVAQPAEAGPGYRQEGVVHGLVELPGQRVEVSEVPARRWHRWGDHLDPLRLPDAYAHTGRRAPFAFPDGTTVDWVLSPDGFRDRRSPPGAAPDPAPDPALR
jgi:hypothetical protein